MATSEAKQVRFQTTRWSMVSAAGVEETARREALSQLFEQYWQPIYVFIRRQGHSLDDARDLTQSFMLEMLEKGTIAKANPQRGRFRSFLLGCVKYFLSHEREKAKAKKRVFIPTQHQECKHLENKLSDESAPEENFDKVWLEQQILHSIKILHQDISLDEQHKVLPVSAILGMEAFHPDHKVEATKALNPAERQKLSRLRKKFGKILREQIAQTLENPADLEDEIRYLFEIARK